MTKHSWDMGGASKKAGNLWKGSIPWSGSGNHPEDDKDRMILKMLQELELKELK